MIEHPAVKSGVSLAPFTTYKVGGDARLFAEPSDLGELREILALVPDGMTVLVLGRGSNVVISERGIDGLVLKLGRSFQVADVRLDGMVVAGAGVTLPKLARFAASRGRAGLEFYVGIPGSVGGAIRMNAGGHGSDTAHVLDHAVILDTATNETVRATPIDLGLAYRHSNLGDGQIVVQATYNTTTGNPEALEEELRSVTRWRKEHQPGGTLNAGSIFKNPEEGSAGAIIDGLGLKGRRFGSVQVSPIHANFLVATDATTADDIFAFVQQIRSTVRDRTGIDLEPEIRFLGEFSHGGDRV